MLQRLACTCVLGALLALASMLAIADDWQPISPEDLQLKRMPQAPTAGAIYLYRQVDRDDANFREHVYERIKILTEEGRERANVEIPYVKDRESIRGLEARTIRPDGTVVKFDGEVYEKPLLKRTGYSVMSKSFTLPAAEVGSIIEYRYYRNLRFGWVFDSRWLISSDLFMRRGVFSLRPNRTFLLRWSWPIGLPPDTKGPVNERGLINLEAHDVPAFVTEEYMPPEDALKYRVEFIYEGEETSQRDEASYWKAANKSLNSRVARFVKGERALGKEVARLVQPGDSEELKARKIYARVQQIRNLSFERSRSQEEIRHENIAENHDAEDVLEHGYGYADEISWLTYGLLRAAKLETAVLYVPPRDDVFFDPRWMNSRLLTACVLYVRLGESAVFIDPGTPLMPFAILPWNETAVTGLRLNDQGGAWMSTTLPSANESRVERKATVKVSPGGSLEGKVTVSYTGLEASWRRLSARNDDATERRKFLEEELEANVPVGINVKLTNTPEWTNAEAPLVAEFDFTAPGWAIAAGSRSLLTMGLFGARDKHSFGHSARVHPVYFTFPYQHTDDIALELPPGWQVSSVPQARTSDIKAAKYSSTALATGNTLSIKRELVMNTIFVQPNSYGALYNFYQTVRAGDEDQIVVTKH